MAFWISGGNLAKEQRENAFMDAVDLDFEAGSVGDASPVTPYIDPNILMQAQYQQAQMQAMYQQAQMQAMYQQAQMQAHALAQYQQAQMQAQMQAQYQQAQATEMRTGLTWDQFSGNPGFDPSVYIPGKNSVSSKKSWASTASRGVADSSTRKAEPVQVPDTGPKPRVCKNCPELCSQPWHAICSTCHRKQAETRRNERKEAYADRKWKEDVARARKAMDSQKKEIKPKKLQALEFKQGKKK